MIKLKQYSRKMRFGKCFAPSVWQLPRSEFFTFLSSFYPVECRMIQPVRLPQ